MPSDLTAATLDSLYAAAYVWGDYGWREVKGADATAARVEIQRRKAATAAAATHASHASASAGYRASDESSD